MQHALLSDMDDTEWDDEAKQATEFDSDHYAHKHKGGGTEKDDKDMDFYTDFNPNPQDKQHNKPQKHTLISSETRPSYDHTAHFDAGHDASELDDDAKAPTTATRKAAKHTSAYPIKTLAEALQKGCTSTEPARDSKRKSKHSKTSDIFDGFKTKSDDERQRHQRVHEHRVGEAKGLTMAVANAYFDNVDLGMERDDQDPVANTQEIAQFPCNAKSATKSNGAATWSR